MSDLISDKLKGVTETLTRLGGAFGGASDALEGFVHARDVLQYGQDVAHEMRLVRSEEKNRAEADFMESMRQESL